MTSPTALPRISSRKPNLSPGELLTEGERERLDAINRELDRRLTIEDATSGLIAFTQYTFPRYKAEPFHRLVAAHLDRVIAGDIRRLMIFAPPQHGKSELTSVRFPAYWLGRRPDDPVIITSYAAELAYSKSRQARQVVESAEFAHLFPDVRTNPESRAVNNWSLAAPHRGELLAAGVGGPVTGHGAMLGIIDDPVENWEQAQSEAYRTRAWEWYRGTFRTRIWEEGSIVLIMTRWHSADLAGKLLAMDEGEWTVLRLPALSEGEGDPLGRAEGEPLAPGRYSKDALLSLKRDVGSMAWAAEYQGTPRAPEGNRFKRHWFDVVPGSAAQAFRVRYWDKAGTRDGGDYTAGVLMSWVPGGYWYVEDVVRGEWSSLERETVIRRTAEADRARFGDVEIWVEQEPGSGGKDSAEYTIRNLAGFTAYAERASGTKEIRAEPFAAQCEAGNVKLVRGDWNETYLDELTVFPNGLHDDQVDASSGAFNRLLGLGQSYEETLEFYEPVSISPF